MFLTSNNFLHILIKSAHYFFIVKNECIHNFCSYISETTPTASSGTKIEPAYGLTVLHFYWISTFSIVRKEIPERGSEKEKNGWIRFCPLFFIYFIIFCYISPSRAMQKKYLNKTFKKKNLSPFFYNSDVKKKGEKYSVY